MSFINYNSQIKDSKGVLNMHKNILTIVGITALFLGILVAPSISSIELPESSLIYIEAPLLDLSINHTIYHWIKSWSGKPFPRNTLMFIGSGVGFRKHMCVRIYVFAHCPACPSKLDVYSDGEYYDTIYSDFWGPISSRRYPLDYYEKGFHTLTYVYGKNNSSGEELDVQIGFKGSLLNILPYLILKNPFNLV